jgi:hypothetical protein
MYANTSSNQKALTVTPMLVKSSAQEIPVVYTSIPEISSNSDVIVIGRVSDAKEIVNTAREPGEASKADPDYFSIGQIYEVQVDEYLKGEGEKVIYVVQHEGFLSTKDKQPGETEINEAKKDYGAVPLNPDKTYLMFLRYSRHRYENYPQGAILIQAGHPWLFDYSEPGCVRVVEPLSELYPYFPPLPSPEFIDLIHKTPTEFQNGAPYPTPSNNSLCPQSPDQSEPYP